jgi:EF-P beta-lysylation protein EpmB
MQFSEKHSPDLWRTIMRRTFTNWETLADFLELPEDARQQILKKTKFPLNLPLRLASKITKGTLDDPILKQFLPTNQELIQQANFLKDPVGDQAAQKSSKLLHKYAGRMLIVSTGACAMNCRFCFRQNFDYEVNRKNFEEELQIISQDRSISEVILSGGDPLSLSDTVLENLMSQLEKIPHIKRIRFHTRFPVGIPERITDSFVSLMQNITKAIWFVLHVNHPLELDEDLFGHLKKLQKAGVTVVTQSVLLQGVNDNVETLFQLFEMLVNQGIAPYYLHQLDRVQGTGHFEVQEEKGKELIGQLLKRLPGYAVPRFVAEIAGAPGKTHLV